MTLSNFSDISPRSPADTPTLLDGGNVPGPDATNRQPLPPTLDPNAGTLIWVGQSLNCDSPSTDPDALISDYTPHHPSSVFDTYTDQWVLSGDPEPGTSGIGGSVPSRVADILIDNGTYGAINQAILDVGGSSSSYWIPGGDDFRKLELGSLGVWQAGLTPTAIIYAQGVADSTTMLPEQWLSNFESFVSWERSHGITCPIYLNVDSQPGGQLSADPVKRAQEAAFAQTQYQAATSLYSQNVRLGTIYDNTDPRLWAPDGHHTLAGYDFFAQIWAADLSGPSQITIVQDGLAARLPGGHNALLVGDKLVRLPNGFDKSWHLIGTLDGDNLVFQQNQSGSVEIQLADATGPQGGGLVSHSPLGYHAVATGDFNRDGHDDIIYSCGDATQIAFMDGTQELGGGALSYNPYLGTDYRIAGTSSTFKSGETDLVWRNSSGMTQIQRLDGLDPIGGGLILQSPFDSSWTFVGASDFNNDGLDDLVWTKDGRTEIQFMSGITPQGGGDLINSPFDDNWRCVGVRPNQPELIFQRQTDGLLEHVTVQELTVTGGGLYSVPALNADPSLSIMFGQHLLSGALS